MARTTWWRVLGAAAVVFAAGCGDYSIALPTPDATIMDTDVEVIPEGGPELRFQPKVLDFGYVEQGAWLSKPVTVKNVGDEDLFLGELTIAGSTTFEIEGGGADVKLEPGQTRRIQIVFTPESSDEEADFAFISNDPRATEGSVSLLGTGANRSIFGEPNPLNFADVDGGDVDVKVLHLVNDGNADVTVTELISDDPAFEAVPFSAPVVIPEGGSHAVDVSFTPSGPGFYNANLSIVSNARGNPPIVLMRGSSEIGAPEAICTVTPDPVTAIHGRATWKGNQSFDPNGRPITHQWTLVSKPAGSASRMPGGTSANRSGFQADVVGDYVGQLVVTNDLGASSQPCLVTLTAESNASLWVEMSWAHSGDDMDLHLIRNGANRNSNNDCYYSNCIGGLAWGQAGAADNPRLDLDNIPGRGPENINITAPSDASYTVDVHDYPGSVYQGANAVHVRIFVDGLVVFDETRNLTGEDVWERFARVDWAAGVATVTPL